MRLHAVVADLGTARAATSGGATVVQLRLKDVSTDERVRVGRLLMRLGVPLIINDDVDAALRLGAAGVHLGQEDPGTHRAVAAGLTVGLSVSDPVEAVLAERSGAAYAGAGPVWATPSKPDAGEPIGLGGLAHICAAVSIPVIAIGGVDAGNAAACIGAGAFGVAVVRAAPDSAVVLAAIQAALRRPGVAPMA